MTDLVGDRPDEERRRLLRSVFVPSPLSMVAEAVSVATEHERRRLRRARRRRLEMEPHPSGRWLPALADHCPVPTG